MFLTQTDESELLITLYKGPLEEPAWSTFLSRLASRLEADYAYMHLLRGGAPFTDPTGLFFFGNRPNAAIRDRYYQELHRFDPMRNQELQPNRIYSFEELLDPLNAGHELFRKGFLEPGGMNYGRLIRVVEPSGGSAWLMISRQQNDFGPATVSYLSALAPHLQIALRYFTEIGRERLRAELSADAVRRLNFGWITLDNEGRLIDSDAEGRRLLHEAGTRQLSLFGRVEFPSKRMNRALWEAIRAFSVDADPKPSTLHVSDDPWLDMLVLPIGDRAVLGAAEKPVAVAYLHGEQRSMTDKRSYISSLFGLSLNEAAIALALSRGQTIAEAAQELNLTIETARSYTKQIYAKTGARGQADLVRLILASVVSLI